VPDEPEPDHESATPTIQLHAWLRGRARCVSARVDPELWFEPPDVDGDRLERHGTLSELAAACLPRQRGALRRLVATVSRAGARVETQREQRLEVRGATGHQACDLTRCRTRRIVVWLVPGGPGRGSKFLLATQCVRCCWRSRASV